MPGTVTKLSTDVAEIASNSNQAVTEKSHRVRLARLVDCHSPAST